METTNWGRWGDTDERGALNLLTPDVVASAAGSIRTGKVYTLGIPIQSKDVPLMDYRGTPMRLTLQNESDEGIYAAYGCAPGTGAHEDILVFASHTTSHMDALCHVYGDSQHYNGFPAASMKTHTGAQHLGIEKVDGFAARCVLLDMVRHLADGAGWVELGRNLSGAELEACAAAQGTEIRAGDVVLIRTGYLDFWFANSPNIPFEQAGIGADAANWLADRDVVAVGSDNAAIEVIPFDSGDFLNVHKILLVERGIYMLEFLNLKALADDETYEGLITVAPLKVTGATGSPINPVVIG